MGSPSFHIQGFQGTARGEAASSNDFCHANKKNFPLVNYYNIYGIFFKKYSNGGESAVKR